MAKKTKVTEDGEVILNDEGDIATPALGEYPGYPFWKTPYNHDRNAETLKFATICPEPTLTQQHQEHEANINTIVERFNVTGQLPQVALPPMSGDFDEAFDYTQAMQLIVAAKNSFMGLPAAVRDAFNNNPALFVSKVEDMLSETDVKKLELNKTNLRAMGLMVEPGPIADKTSLGDVLAAIKEWSGKAASPAPDPSKPA